MTGTLLDGQRYSNEPVWRPLLQGITFLAGGQCSSAHMPRIPIDMSHKKKKKKIKALQGIQRGRKWGQDYIGGGKSPPDRLPFELGLKEGQEGAHPYLSEYTTNTAGPARRPGPVKRTKSSGSEPREGPLLSETWEAVDQGEDLEFSQLCSLCRVPHSACVLRKYLTEWRGSQASGITI